MGVSSEVERWLSKLGETEGFKGIQYNWYGILCSCEPPYQWVWIQVVGTTCVEEGSKTDIGGQHKNKGYVYRNHLTSRLR